MIKVENVSKRYGKFLAADSISLEVQPGELTVLLGPNGAGKSTLIKCICGLLRYQGSITVDGFDNKSVEAKRMLGYVPELPALYPMLTVGEHLEFIAKAYRLPDWQARVDELLERFEMDDKLNKLGKELSKGMQQKLSVCCALLPSPRAVILDEPLVGLDPHGIREIKAAIAGLKAEGCALLISTHMIESMEENWDSTYILKNGTVAAVCRRGELSEGRSLEDMYFEITEGEGSEDGDIADEDIAAAGRATATATNDTTAKGKASEADK